MPIVVSGALEEDRTCTLFRPSVFAAVPARKFPPKFPHLPRHNPQTGSPKYLQLFAFCFRKLLLISQVCDRVILPWTNRRATFSCSFERTETGED
ncbi:hypothetical protein [Microcoleus sp. B9-D4]|uniref:hypothetical protein n=1 Tax=Microcoleus sp. B9-D4 TaxID=2818711 RepID=UPI002FCF6144